MSWIYITIENFNREAHAKLLLSYFALKKNYNVVIGEKNELRPILDKFPKGIIIEKSLGPGLKNFMKLWKKHGHKIIGLDEEALTYFSDQQYFNINLEKNIQKFADKLILLGDNHRKTISKILPKKYYEVIGNPRYDLYLKNYRKVFDQDVKKIKKSHKKFILITSRFGNVFMNRKSMGKIKKLLDINYQKQSEYLAPLFVKLSIDLAKKFPKKNFIIRPHPSESIEFWKKKLKKFKNCKVIYKKNIAPWIIASDLVIQNRCTTGLEAFMLNKPTISFDPLFKKDPHKKLFNEISYVTKSQKDVIKLLNQKKIKVKSKNTQIKKYLSSYNNLKSTSEKLVESFNNLRIKSEQSLNFYSIIQIKLKRILSLIFQYLSGLKSTEYRKYLRYTEQKIGLMSSGELTRIMNYYFTINKTKKYFIQKKITKNIYFFKVTK